MGSCTSSPSSLALAVDTGGKNFSPVFFCEHCNTPLDCPSCAPPYVPKREPKKSLESKPQVQSLPAVDLIGEKREHVFSITIHPNDTNARSNVYDGAYFQYFLNARRELFGPANIADSCLVHGMLFEVIALPVVVYIIPAKVGDVCSVVTKLLNVTSTTVDLVHELRNEDDPTLCYVRCIVRLACFQRAHQLIPFPVDSPTPTPVSVAHTNGLIRVVQPLPPFVVSACHSLATSSFKLPKQVGFCVLEQKAEGCAVVCTLEAYVDSYDCDPLGIATLACCQRFLEKARYACVHFISGSTNLYEMLRQEGLRLTVSSIHNYSMSEENPVRFGDWIESRLTYRLLEAGE